MKRVGVLGTFVWDTIWHPGREGDEPMEQWGGIAYSLAAFSAACPPGWQVEPIVKVGQDLAEEAFHLLASLPNIGSTSAVRVVPESNNRVELRYLDSADRTERLSGGVSSWGREELLPLIQPLDALYVNFISGFELDLEVARALHATVSGPLYADLHSLFLGPPGAGPRPARRLEDWLDWARCFDYVQLNETELSLTGPSGSDPRSELGAIRGSAPAAVLVTRGARGASVLCRYDMRAGVRSTSTRDADAELVVQELPLPGVPLDGDPTGCGDVWGSVVFAGLLHGLPLARAARRGHEAAAVKMKSARIDSLAASVASALGPWPAEA